MWRGQNPGPGPGREGGATLMSRSPCSRLCGRGFSLWGALFSHPESCLRLQDSGSLSFLSCLTPHTLCPVLPPQSPVTTPKVPAACVGPNERQGGGRGGAGFLDQLVYQPRTTASPFQGRSSPSVTRG